MSQSDSNTKRPSNKSSRRGGGRGDRRGRGRRNQDRRNPRGGGARGDRQRGADRGDAPRGPSLEYVLVQPDRALSSEITGHPGPLRWRVIPDIALLNPGLYLRYRGSLQLVTRELAISDAVLYALWRDENLAYRFRDGWGSPGLRAAFLVRTPFEGDEGPPWIPIDAAIPDSIDAWDRGLLSSQLDPIHCAMFDARLQVETSGLQVSAHAIFEDRQQQADDALTETMVWLARNKNSDHPAAVTARTMLIDKGHGLQRAGLVAMRRTDVQTAELLEDVLGVLAPEITPVLQAVQKLWVAEDADQRTQFVQLARALQPHIANEKSVLQEPRNLAVLTAWLTGIFGSRPDRGRRRPARSLFAAFRLLRQLRGDIDAFAHPDVDLPTFPTSRALSDEITRELSIFPQHETDLERLIRALAVGESTRDFGGIHLDHIRPFSLSYRRLRGYPIAARTLLGRYDGIVTMWSFRGRERDRDGIPPRALDANFVFETTSWASIRAYGRVLGAGGRGVPAFAEALGMRSDRGGPHHPDVLRIAELHGLDAESVAERLSKATRARRANTQRVSDAIGAHEYMIAHLQAHPDALASWAPIEPQWDDQEDTVVRRHYMYWRTYCRSFWPGALDAYTAFVTRITPELASLPPKHQNEALALMRNWSHHADAEQVTSIVEPLLERFDAILKHGEGAPASESVFNLLSVLAGSSIDAWTRGVERLLEHPNWAQAEWHRIIGGVRKAAVREELITSEIFTTLAERLAEASTVGAATGRVEWLRQLLGRGHGAAHTRWLLHRDAWPEVVYTPAFETWFKERAVAAIEAPETAVHELLRLASTLMTDESVDIPLVHLAQTEPERTAAHIDVLLEASRGLSAVSWMAQRREPDAAQANAALTLGLSQATTAAELRTLAQLVATMNTCGMEVAPALRDGLAQRLNSHPLQDRNRPARDAMLDAWRFADMDLDSETACALAEHAARGAAHEKGALACWEFVRWAVDRTLTREISDDLFAAITDDVSLPLFESAFQDLQWPAAVAKIVEMLSTFKRGSGPRRGLWRVLRQADRYAALETALDAHILKRASVDSKAACTDIDTFLPHLESWIAAGEHDGPDTAKTPAADASQASVVRETVAEDVKNGAGEPELEAAADDAGKTPTPAPSALERLSEHTRVRALERIRESLQFWKRTLETVDADAIQALNTDISRALTHRMPARTGLRAQLYVRVLEHAQARGIAVRDPRNVLANPMIPFWIHESPFALSAGIEAVFEAASDLEDARVELLRDSFTISCPATPVVHEEPPSDVSEEVTSEEADSPVADTSDVDTSDGDTSDGDPAAESVEVSQPPVKQKTTYRLSASAQAWTRPEDGAPALALACLQRLLAREENASLSVRCQGGREIVSLRWRQRRKRRS